MNCFSHLFLLVRLRFVDFRRLFVGKFKFGLIMFWIICEASVRLSPVLELKGQRLWTLNSLFVFPLFFLILLNILMVNKSAADSNFIILLLGEFRQIGWISLPSHWAKRWNESAINNFKIKMKSFSDSAYGFCFNQNLCLFESKH